jgi:DNA-binding winged helix-turn-helix (wHTH) protein
MVVGSSGVGKSNLAGFLGGRPDVVAANMALKPEQYCLLLLDVNRLPELTAPFFYRSLYQTLQDAAEQLEPQLGQTIQTLNFAQVNWADSFAVLTLLQRAHRLFIRQAGKKIVWLFDRFDEACQRLDAQTLNSLRGLRDQFKGELIYLVFTRQPLARLRPLAEIDEFYEILAANTCWLGPMVERDSRWMTGHMAERLRTSFTEPTVRQLLTITGGLPAFLKGACLAVAQGDLEPIQSSQEWVNLLLARPEFQRNCQEIWRDLTLEEQQTLNALSAGTEARLLDAQAVAYLQRTGLLTPQATLFSPIFAAHVAQQRGSEAGLIELHPKTRAVLRGGVALNIELTPSEDRLLSFLLEHPGEICQKDTLIHAVWPHDYVGQGISDERLAQLIKRLRDKIEPNPVEPMYIQTVRGRGYRLVQPGD